MNLLGIFPLFGFLAIILLIIFKIVLLRRKGIIMHKSGTGHRRSVFVLNFIFLIILAVWLAALTEQTFYPTASCLPGVLTKIMIESIVLEAAGTIVITLSVVAMFITISHFRESMRFGMSFENKGALITSGIFSISRNPFFLSLNLFFIGQAMVFPAIIFIAMAVLAVTSIHFYILREEKFMVQGYTDDYLKYKQRVRRYL